MTALIKRINWSNVKYWFKRMLPIMGCILFMFLYFDSCHRSNGDRSRYENNLEAMEAQVKDVKLKNGQLAQEKHLLSVSLRELEEQVYLKDDSIKSLVEKLKKPKVVIKWKTKVKFDTMFFPYNQPVSLDFNKKFKKQTEWFSISGIADQYGVTLNPPSIFNTQRLAVGFKKGKPVVTVTNSNPHIVTEDIEGQVIDIPKKKWVLSAGGSIVPVEPYVLPSINLGYKLLEF